MKRKLLKSLLAIALLCMGVGNVWADEVVLYSENFDSESTVPSGWTQANGTLSLESSGSNKWLRETTSGTGSRTAWYTGTAIKDAIGKYTSYTLEFDCLMGIKLCIFTAHESYQYVKSREDSIFPARCTSSRLIKICIINKTIFKSYFLQI